MSEGLSLWYSRSMRSMTCVSSGWISTNPWRVLAPASAIWKTLDSASSSSCPTSLPMRFKALSAISVETSMSFLRIAHSRTISA